LEERRRGINKPEKDETEEGVYKTRSRFIYIFSACDIFGPKL
jgi:hypothetical protein